MSFLSESPPMPMRSWSFLGNMFFKPTSLRVGKIDWYNHSLIQLVREHRKTSHGLGDYETSRGIAKLDRKSRKKKKKTKKSLTHTPNFKDKKQCNKIIWHPKLSTEEGTLWAPEDDARLALHFKMVWNHWHFFCLLFFKWHFKNGNISTGSLKRPYRKPTLSPRLLLSLLKVAAVPCFSSIALLCEVCCMVGLCDIPWPLIANISLCRFFLLPMCPDITSLDHMLPTQEYFPHFTAKVMESYKLGFKNKTNLSF